MNGTKFTDKDHDANDVRRARCDTLKWLMSHLAFCGTNVTNATLWKTELHVLEMLIYIDVMLS